MKSFLSGAALAALIAISPAFAAETGNGGATQPAPDATGQTQEKVGNTDVAKTQPKFVGDQADNETLASNLIGTTIYNPTGDALGDVNDLVLAENGKVSAVIVGVGGFLGIGEKSVGIAFAAIDRTTDENGAPKLVVKATADEVEAAPQFLSLLDKQRMQEQSQPPANPSAPAPAPTPMN